MERTIETILGFIDLVFLWGICKRMECAWCAFCFLSLSLCNADADGEGGAFKSNNKATFYTDTEKSPFLRGRRSIVPYVSVIFLGASANSGYDLLGARTFLEVGVGEFLCIFFFANGLDLIEYNSINFQMYTRVSFLFSWNNICLLISTERN